MARKISGLTQASDTAGVVELVGNQDGTTKRFPANLFQPQTFRGALLAGLSASVGPGVITNWNAPEYDSDGLVQTTSGFTIPAGVNKVRLTAQIISDADVGGGRFYIQKNGSANYLGGGGHNNTDLGDESAERASAISGIIPVVQGDTFELELYDVGADANHQTWFQIEVIE